MIIIDKWVNNFLVAFLFLMRFMNNLIDGFWKLWKIIKFSLFFLFFRNRFRFISRYFLFFVNWNNFLFLLCNRFWCFVGSKDLLPCINWCLSHFSCYLIFVLESWLWEVWLRIFSHIAFRDRLFFLFLRNYWKLFLFFHQRKLFIRIVNCVQCFLNI